MLIEPYVLLRYWDYGEPGQQYPCWMVLRDDHSGGEVAYCEYGFGPRCPWGLITIFGAATRPNATIAVVASITACADDMLELMRRTGLDSFEYYFKQQPFPD